MKIVAVLVAVLAVLAAGGFAWQKAKALEETAAELARANSELEKAKADARAMSADAAAARKELTEQKMAADQLRADLLTAQSFLVAEKAIGARLREELVKTKEQLAMASRQRAVQAAPAARTLDVRPMVIRAGPSGSAIGAGAPAR